MGNSFRDAWNVAIGKIGEKISGRVKSPKLHEHPQDIFDAETDSIVAFEEPQKDDLTFAEIMQQSGVEAVNFNTSKTLNIEYCPDIVRESVASDSPPGQSKPAGGTKVKVFPARKIPLSPKKSHTQVVIQTASRILPNSLTPKLEQPRKIEPSISASTLKALQPDYKITVEGRVTPNPCLIDIAETKKLIVILDAPEQIVSVPTDNEREINIGLDFGTSSVKVVVGDEEIETAFAVPFFAGNGLDSYLLPSRVWLGEGGYSLVDGGQVYRNLKLRLMGNSCGKESFTLSVAFIALVIRHVKGWLFCEHADIYKNTHILWKLTLGLPAESYDKSHLVELYKKIAGAAWWLTLGNEHIIPKSKVDSVCAEVYEKSLSEIHFPKELEDVEFDVVPELAAQIFGFLTSTRFDARAKNYYMMVDVGAGTIDSTVFHAIRDKGKFSFNYFANFVELNGVANLHAARVGWIRSKTKDGEEFNVLQKHLDAMDTSTDYMGAVPEDLNGYFDGVKFTFNQPVKSPDYGFYKDRVREQVLNKTLRKATTLFPYRDIKDMPLFVCGGGSRMSFYKKLEDDLLSHPNASWFSFKPQILEVPDILNAPGVAKEDFDRLSVAFGLSFVRVGRCVPPSSNSTSFTVRPSKGCPGCGSRTICYCR
jgi:hypothetical protein